MLGRWCRPLLVVSVILGLLGMAELGLRGWVYSYRDVAERYDTRSRTFVPVPGVHEDGIRRIVINEAGFAGSPLREPKPDWRIVGLGDSCTFGSGNAVGTYQARL